MKKTNLRPVVATIINAVWFPLVIIYYELIFKLSLGINLFSLGTFELVCFSIACGAVMYLLSALPLKPVFNHVIGCVLVAVAALPFLVEYFIYKGFKEYYDINTITNGAGGLGSEFMDETLATVFSSDGITKIILYMIPLVLMISLGKMAMLFEYTKKIHRLCAAGTLALFAAATALVAAFSPLALLHGAEYSFGGAVEKLGLLSAVRLDLFADSIHEKNEAFEDVSLSLNDVTPPVPSDQGQTDEQTNDPEPVVYTPNMLDIDFANLEASGRNAKKYTELNSYVASCQPSMKNEYTGIFKGKNLIFITAEAFTAELVDPELNPTIYRLATKGINFTDYYQPTSAGTTGGEYQNIFGMLPTSGGSSMVEAADNLNYYTIGSQLDRLGYYGKAFHNNSYTFYSRNKTHEKLGYSDGFMGYGNGMEEYVRKRWPQSDYEMMVGTLPTYIDKQPFNVYYMSVSGHSAYTRIGNTQTSENWDRVSHLECSDIVKGYYAANLELEDALTYLVDTLYEKGIADDTVICISADHFPYGIDTKNAYLGNMPNLSELYGYDVTDVFQKDHNRLIIWCGELEKHDPIVVSQPTFSLDILPTLSNLFGTEFDSRLMVGRDVFSDAPALVFNAGYDWKTEYGTYYNSKGKFVPNDPEVELPEGYVDAVKATVRNKRRFCAGVLDYDYYRYLFG